MGSSGAAFSFAPFGAARVFDVAGDWLVTVFDAYPHRADRTWHLPGFEPDRARHRRRLRRVPAAAAAGPGLDAFGADCGVFDLPAGQRPEFAPGRHAVRPLGAARALHLRHGCARRRLSVRAASAYAVAILCHGRRNDRHRGGVPRHGTFVQPDQPLVSRAPVHGDFRGFRRTRPGCAVHRPRRAVPAADPRLAGNLPDHGRSAVHPGAAGVFPALETLTRQAIRSMST